MGYTNSYAKWRYGQHFKPNFQFHTQMNVYMCEWTKTVSGSCNKNTDRHTRIVLHAYAGMCPRISSALKLYLTIPTVNRITSI